MKKFTIIILFLSIPVFLNAQFCEWTDPVALTDSVSFNTNPNIIITDDYYSGDVFMFYEKKWNEDSQKQIYMRNITSMADEQLAIGDGIFEFRNPQLYITGYSNCRYFLIYESDLTGNFDLYGIEFFEDATFSVPFRLTETDYDENSCYINNDYYYNVVWETNEQINFGIDASFLDNKLYTTIEYYNKKTKDLLITIPVAIAAGFTSNPKINGGEVLNRGLEFDIGFRDQIGDLSWSISGNISTLYNEVLSLGGGEPIAGNSMYSSGMANTWTEEGDEIGYFQGYLKSAVIKLGF